MIKSDKKVKNISIHHSNLSKPPIKCYIANVSSALAIMSERKHTPLEGFQPAWIRTTVK